MGTSEAQHNESLIGLIFGFIVFFSDLILFCIFLSRVKMSFTKSNYMYDDEWRQANDYWLKLSRVSGVIFCLFHLGIMAIVIVDILMFGQNQKDHDSLLKNDNIAHIYWIFQSLWILLTNLAIVLITQRMYRVYKTTSTPFTPLKDWMSNNQKCIEYVIWTVYILISLTIIIQYCLIVIHWENWRFLTTFSIINAVRNFATAIILTMQLIIACFFAYIAHKSQKQTNWNAQSRAIICKETAKLAFIVIFLCAIVGVILYTAFWWLINMDYKITLNAPYTNSNERVFWGILEWFGFWLILYLTRLRKPSDQQYLDKDLPSSTQTKSKLFLKRTLSSRKQKQEALKQLKLRELEKRKQAFKDREKKRISKDRVYQSYTRHHHQIPTANNDTFNAIFMNQVAKLDKQKKLKQQLQQQHNNNNTIIEEEKDEEEQQNPIDDINRTNDHELKEDNISNNDGTSENPSDRLNRVKSQPQQRKHVRYNQSDPLLHVTLTPLAQFIEDNGDTTPLNILQEDNSNPLMDKRNSSNSIRQRAATDFGGRSSLQPVENTQLLYGSSHESDGGNVNRNELLPLKKRITVNSNSTCTTMTTMERGYTVETPQNVNTISQMILHPGNTNGMLVMADSDYDSPDEFGITPLTNTEHLPLTRISTGPMKDYNVPHPSPASTVNVVSSPFTPISPQPPQLPQSPQSPESKSKTLTQPSPKKVRFDGKDQTKDMPSPISIHHTSNSTKKSTTPVPASHPAGIYSPSQKSTTNGISRASNIFTPTSRNTTTLSSPSQKYAGLTAINHGFQHYTTPVSVVITPATRKRRKYNRHKTSLKKRQMISDALNAAIEEDEQLEAFWAEKLSTKPSKSGQTRTKSDDEMDENYRVTNNDIIEEEVEEEYEEQSDETEADLNDDHNYDEVDDDDDEEGIIEIDCGSSSDEDDMNRTNLFNEAPIKLFNPQSADQPQNMPPKSFHGYAMHAKTPQPQKSSGWARLKLFSTNSAKSAADKNTISTHDKNNGSGSIGFKKIMAKIGSVFTPHPEKPFSDSAVTTLNNKKSFDFDDEDTDEEKNIETQNYRKKRRSTLDDTPQPSTNTVTDKSDKSYNDQVTVDLTYETQKAITKRISSQKNDAGARDSINLVNNASGPSKLSTTKTYQESTSFYPDELRSFPKVRISDVQHHDQSGYILRFDVSNNNKTDDSGLPATPQTKITTSCSNHSITSASNTRTTTTTKTVTMHGINDINKLNVNTDALQSSKGIDLMSLNEKASYDDITARNSGSEPEPENNDKNNDISIAMNKAVTASPISEKDKQTILNEILNDDVMNPCHTDHIDNAAQEIFDIVLDAFKEDEATDGQSPTMTHPDPRDNHILQHSFENSLTEEAADQVGVLSSTKQFDINIANLSKVNEEKEREFRDHDKFLPDLPPTPLTDHPNKGKHQQTSESPHDDSHHSQQDSRDMSQYGHETFFHQIQLKPTQLKRSHSDPDIRVRDKIWDQLLFAFEQMRQNEHNPEIDVDGLETSPSPQPMSTRNGIERDRESRRGSITSKFTDYSDYYHMVTNTMRTEVSTNGGEILATTPMESVYGSQLDTLETPNIDHSIDTTNSPNIDDDRDMSRMSYVSHASHNTQLSFVETDQKFNLFGWFSSNGSKNPKRVSNFLNKQRSDDSESPKKKVRPKSINVNMDNNKVSPKAISVSEFGSDDEHEPMKNQKNKKLRPKAKKKSSKKKWRNLVKRHHQDSLDIPSHLIPLDKLHESSPQQSQLTSVRLDGVKNGKGRPKKMTMDPRSINKYENGDVNRQMSKSVTKKGGRSRNNSKVKQMAARFEREGGFGSDSECCPPSTTKLKTRSSKSNKRKKLKSRMKKKKQTKQWISNVHQVF